MDLSLASLLIAFTGGVVMFLAPCTLPLVPAFLASLVPGGQKGSQSYARTLSVKTILFSVGFTVIFVVLGVLTGFVGSALTPYKLFLSQIGGVIIILFGLSLMHVVTVPALQKTFSKLGFVALNPNRVSTPLILGSLFALGWTPCAGPILASILFLASQSGTALEGGITLFVFSLGLTVPFILLGMLYAHTISIFNAYERYSKSIRFVSGSFLVFLGVILFLGNSILMTDWGFALYSFFGYVPMCTYF